MPPGKYVRPPRAPASDHPIYSGDPVPLYAGAVAVWDNHASLFDVYDDGEFIGRADSLHQAHVIAGECLA